MHTNTDERGYFYTQGNLPKTDIKLISRVGLLWVRTNGMLFDGFL